MSSADPNLQSTPPADLVGGVAAPAPRGAIPKGLLWTAGGAILAVIVVARLAQDISSGELGAEPKQGAREPGSTISKERVKLEMDAGKGQAKKPAELTEKQVADAIAQPAALSAAEAAAAARGSPAGGSPFSEKASTVPSAGDSLRTTSVEKNSEVPLDLQRFGKAAANPAPPPSGRDAASLRTAVGGTEMARPAPVSKEEEELFSRRSSPLMVGGASSGSSGSAGDLSPAQMAALLRGGTPTDGISKTADPISELLKKYQDATGSGAAQGAGGNKQADWLKAQQSAPPPITVFSQPAPQGIVVLPGSVINAVTRTTIRSDLPGDFIGLVTEDLYDSLNGRTVVIPKGSRLSGSASSDLRPGQERALTAIKQVFFPDGRSFDLQGATGSDAEGAAGLYDEVERHYFRRYGVGLVLASIAYAVDRISPNNQVVVLNGAATQQQQTLSSYAGQTLADTTKSYVQQQQQIQDVLIIKAGYPFTILVRQPLSLIPTNARTQ